MKPLLIATTFLGMFLSNILFEEKTLLHILGLRTATDIEILVYDGYEGGYLFFSNDSRQAVILELIDRNILRQIDLINGDYVGQKMKISYTPVMPSDDSSSTGIIDGIDLLK